MGFCIAVHHVVTFAARGPPLGVFRPTGRCSSVYFVFQVVGGGKQVKVFEYIE